MEQPLAVNAENSRAKVQNVGGDSSGILHRMHVNEKAISAPGEGLDEARLVRIISEHLSQAPHSGVQAVVKIHERAVRPKRLSKLLT